MDIKIQKMESKRIEQNLKNTYRPEPLTNQKLHTAITTMLRNTVAGKAAAGPANTSNNETVTVSNPQEELAAANAKIK